MRDLKACAESLIDLTIREVGALDALLLVALATDVPVDTELEAGDVVRVPTGFVPPPSRRLLPHARARAPVRSIIIDEGQSLIDVAVQEYAGIEGLLLLHQLNARPSLLSVPATGQLLRIDAATAATDPTAAAMRRRGLHVTTGPQLMTGGGDGQFNSSQFNSSQFN